MRKALVIGLLILISSATYGQKQDSLKQNQTTGTVYFIRITGMPLMMSTFSAFIDDELVCRIDDRRYSTHELKPGKHFLTIQAGGKKLRNKGQQIELMIEAGKTYYIQALVETGLVYNVFCEEVTEFSATRLMNRSNVKAQKTCL